MLAIHLINHEGTMQEDREIRVAHLEEHLGWEADFARQVVRYAQRDGLVRRTNGRLELTDDGRAYANEAVVKSG
jgi:manganese/zinc/iron transport system permease protein